MGDEGIDKLSSEHEKAGESHAESSMAQAELQGHEVEPDPGETVLITQMETSVSGTVEEDSVGREVVSEMCTAEITPTLNEAMEGCMSEQGSDQHPETSIGILEKSSMGHEVVPKPGTAERTPNRNEETEQNGDQCSDAEKRTVEKDTVSPLLGGGGSLALLSMQYREEGSDDLSER